MLVVPCFPELVFLSSHSSMPVTRCSPTGNFKDQILGIPYENLKDHYVLHERELGKGQFGIVRACLELTTGAVYACKTIKKAYIKVS